MQRDIGGESPSMLEEVPMMIESVKAGSLNTLEKVLASDGRYQRTIRRLPTMRT
jgi:hypothetical protein